MDDELRQQRQDRILEYWNRVRYANGFMTGFTAIVIVALIVWAVVPLSQTQLPITQEKEVLTLVTQVHEIQLETQVREIELAEKQLREIQPEILEIRMPVTTWLSSQEPQVLVLEPETDMLEIKIPLPEWLRRHVPKMQALEIRVPVTLLEETQPETQWLAIQMTLAQLQEVQGTDGLVFVAQLPETEMLYDIGFWVFIFYILVFLLYRRVFVRVMNRRMSREVCVVMAETASDSLAQGDTVRASVSIDRLLSALSDFIRQKTVLLLRKRVDPPNTVHGNSKGIISKVVTKATQIWNVLTQDWAATPNIMHANPETIPRKAVFQVIRTLSGNTQIQERLRKLAKGLDSETEPYLSACEFLSWLDKETESYGKAYSKSFLERHPTLKALIPYISGIIVALVAAATLFIQSLS